MKTISKMLLETALRISNASSKDETRAYLMGVHIARQKAGGLVVPNTFIIEACSGVYAAREIVTCELTDFIGDDQELILDAKDLKKLKPFMKTYKGARQYDCEVNDKNIVVKCGPDLVSIMNTQREYPKLESVIPKMLSDSITISFQPEFLVSILEALKTDKGQCAVNLTFNPSNTLLPMLVSIEANDNRGMIQTGVIMPFKSDKALQSAVDYIERKNLSSKVTA